MDITPEFEDSYYDFLSYPQNILDNQLCRPLLYTYAKRLNDATDRLFIKHDSNADVPFRDLNLTGDGFERRNVFSDNKLREQLGDDYNVDAQGTITGSYAMKADPKCRFIFLQADHSRAALRLTKDMLARILSFHQVMPQYLEFLFLFGERTGPNDLRYSGFRERVQMTTPLSSCQMDKIGRSGQHYQLCYNLKTVAMKQDGQDIREHRWSIRQAAICHQFDVVHGTALWIMAKGDLALKDRVQEITGLDGRVQDRSFSTPEDCFRSSLAIHADVAYWASEDWRRYTQYLETVVEMETQGAVLGTRTPGIGRKEYIPEDLERVQIWEEKSKEVEVILYGNIVVLKALRDFYSSMSTKLSFATRNNIKGDIDIFAAQINDAINDSNMHIARIKLLIDITTQRKQLILQHLQSQGAEEIKALTFMSQKEAIAMRIITVVTLLYLPATFVSTFFSTDVVKYQSSDSAQNNGNSDATTYSSLAMSRWLQVTIPLTVTTLLASYLAYRRAKSKVNIRYLSRIWGRSSLLPSHTTKSKSHSSLP